jgi:hypothetical protein
MANAPNSAGQFNGPENEMVSAGIALSGSFFALLVIAIIVHPQIIGSGDAPNDAPTPSSVSKPAPQ